MSDVFISYSRSNLKTAREMAGALRAAGYDVWRDDQIPAHRAYSEVIAERLETAKAVVVIWSAEAAKSEWVRSEAEHARASRKLVQLTIDGARLPMPFDQIQCADLVGWTGQPDAHGWRKVLGSIAELAAARVELRREPDFQLGGVEVSPSSLRMRFAGQDQRVEPKVMEVLVVLRRHIGQTVSRDQLIEACWDGRIVSDDAVNRVIAQVRALGRSFDPPPFNLQTVPKVGFRLDTGEAAESGKSVDAPAAAPVVERTRRAPPARALIAAGLALSAVVVALLAWRFWPNGPALAPGQNGRIDVMQFEPQSNDLGLQKVAAETSKSLVQILAGAGVPVSERPLTRDSASGDAELRIAGTVEYEKSDFATTAQILDRKSGVVLWSDRLTQSPAEQAESPGQIAGEIAFVLHCAMEDRKLAKRPISTEAFGLYLNTCAGVGDGNPGRMLAVTRKLVKAAPDFAAGHAMHSIAAANAANDLRHSPEETAALHAESKAAAETALRLNPNTPKAWSGLALNEGVLSDRQVQNWGLEEEYVRKALKLDPDLPPGRNEYATLLRSTGRMNEALDVLRTADVKDPRAGGDPRIAMLTAAAGDLPGAEARLKELEALNRTSYDSIRWTIAFWWDEPRAALAKLDALSTGIKSKDDVDCYRTYLKEIDSRKASHAHGLPASCRGVESHWRVRMLAREGDVDGALAEFGDPARGWAPTGAAGHINPMILFYPEMASVRRDPRFWTLAAKMRLTDYWLKSGHWPDFCAEPGAPYDCKSAARAAEAARPRA